MSYAFVLTELAILDRDRLPDLRHRCDCTIHPDHHDRRSHCEPQDTQDSELCHVGISITSSKLAGLVGFEPTRRDQGVSHPPYLTASPEHSRSREPVYQFQHRPK